MYPSKRVATRARFKPLNSLSRRAPEMYVFYQTWGVEFFDIPWFDKKIICLQPISNGIFLLVLEKDFWFRWIGKSDVFFGGLVWAKLLWRMKRENMGGKQLIPLKTNVDFPGCVPLTCEDSHACFLQNSLPQSILIGWNHQLVFKRLSNICLDRSFGSYPSTKICSLNLKNTLFKKKVFNKKPLGIIAFFLCSQ